MSLLTLSMRTPKGGGGHGDYGSTSSSHGDTSSSGSSSSDSGSGSSSSSSSPSKGGSTIIYTNGGSSASGNGAGRAGAESTLPWWALLIIVLGIIIVVLFIAGLLYYCLKERKRKAAGKSFRPAHATWKALCLATGLWFPIWLFKFLKKKKSTKSAGFYSKIDEGHASNNTAWQGTTSTATDAPYAQGASGYNASTGKDDARYEPMGYTNARDVLRPRYDDMPNPAREQPIIIGPIEQTNSIPLPTPSPSPAPSMVSAMTAPPPYTGNPAMGTDVYKPPPPPTTYVQAPLPTATYFPGSHPPYLGPVDH